MLVLVAMVQMQALPPTWAGTLCAQLTVGRCLGRRQYLKLASSSIQSAAAYI